jgi:transposase-like protein
MRFELRLPVVKPNTYAEVVKANTYAEPLACPTPGCLGLDFRIRQTTCRRVRDVGAGVILVRRYRCASCGRTFRFYPPGIDRAHTTKPWRSIALMLYAMGLSYGAVARALTRLGYPLSKGAVYKFVQAADSRLQELRRRDLLHKSHQHWQDSCGCRYVEVDSKLFFDSGHPETLTIRSSFMIVEVTCHKANRKYRGVRAINREDNRIEEIPGEVERTWENTNYMRLLPTFAVDLVLGGPQTKAEVTALIAWLQEVAVASGADLVIDEDVRPNPTRPVKPSTVTSPACPAAL